MRAIVRSKDVCELADWPEQVKCTFYPETRSITDVDG